MRWAVVGATGLIGRRLCRHLAAAGHDVAAVSRAGTPVDGAAVAVRWDPAAGGLDPAGVADRDVVVNLAGAGIGDARWTDGRKREIVESRRAATRGIVEALRADGAPRVLVSASAVGFYGTGERECTEATPPGDDFLAATCGAWEREALAARAHGVRVVLTRFGIVLDAHGGALAKQLTPFRLGFGGPLGGGRQWVSWVHIDDAVRLIERAGADPSIEGPVNVVAPRPVRQREFARALGAALHRPALVPTPGAALRLTMGEMATLALHGQRVTPAVALAAGFGYLHPDVDEALRDLLR
ncbi:MAG: TIGR01777 family oxidoreductase [Thermoleophilia bacterium]|nr:TIGR01777 family oxidoreductase [Thermoleophilia bacterium]